MSFLFGGGGSKVKPKYTGIQLQTASQTAALTIAWGANRFAPNLIWYDDFKSHKQKQKAGKGGPTITDYTYSASCIFALCEGGNPATGIQGIGKVWKDKDTSATLSSLGMTLFPGTIPQAPWGYLTSKHPTKAFNYANVAYLAVANYDLGNSATLPNHSFEVKSQRVGTGYTGGDDADCALIISDFLFNENYGVEMPAAAVDTAQLMSTVNAGTTGDGSYQTYCRAMGFGLSPVLTDQKEAGSVLDQWCRITNTAIVWTGYCLRFVPYCYENVVGNSVTFVPNTTPVYNLTDDDYLSKTNPVQVSRKDPSDCHNQLKLIYLNRANDYNEAPEPWEDQGLIEQFGKRPASDFTAKEITVQAMAVKAVTLMGKRGAYLRNTYTFQLGPAHILIEPMDVVTVVDPQLGTVKVQITRLEEQDEGGFNCTAEEISAGVSTPSSYTPQSGGANPVNTGAAPGSVNTPIIFEPPADLSKGSAQIWAAVSGGNNSTAGQYWGGCAVYVSADNGASYQAVGRIDSPARQGKLSATLAAYAGANPDVTNTAKADLRMSEGELVSVTPTEAANATTLCYVGGEFISFETATLTATNQYDLTGLYRGLYNSTPGSHAVAAPFARLDENIFEYDLPADYVGIPLKFKFPSFNIWGGALQDLSACVEYSYTPNGNGFKIAPPTSTGLAFTRRTQSDGTSIITGTITLGPSTGPYLDHYDVQVAVSPYTDWIDVPAIGAAGTKTSFEPAIASTNYKARARAVSSAVDGIPSAWVESSVVGSGGLESAAPNAPTSLIATGGTLSNALSVTPPAAGAPVAGYRWYAIHGASGSFGSAVLIGQTQIPSFTHTGLGVVDTWRYWAVAYNSVGNSTEVGPQNATTGSGGGGGAIDVEHDEVPIVTGASIFNFKGDGVVVTDAGGGQADIEIAGVNTGLRPGVRGMESVVVNASSGNVPLPAGAVAGDFAVIGAAGGWNPNTPSGWTQFGYLSGTNTSGGGYYKNLSPTDIVNGYVQVTFGDSFRATIAIIVFEGPTNGIGDFDSGRSAGSTGTRSLSIDTDPIDVAVAFGYARDNGNISFSPITTADGSNNAADGSCNIGYYETPGGTVSETITYAADGSGNYGLIVAVKGAPGFVEEAPLDGQEYVRQNGTWVVASSGGAIDIEEEGTPVATSINTINFTGSGVSVTDAGGGVVDVDISGGGGGSGTAGTGTVRINDFGAEMSTVVSTSAYAGKGNTYTAMSDIYISGATIVLNALVNTATYRAYLVSLASTYNVDTILATSPVFTATGTGGRPLVFEFDTPVLILKDQRFGIIIARTDGSTTYALPVLNPNGQGQTSADVWNDGFNSFSVAITNGAVAAVSGGGIGAGYNIGLQYEIPGSVLNNVPKNLMRKIPLAANFPTRVTSGSTPVLTDDPVEGLLYNSGSAAITYSVHTGLSGDFEVVARLNPNVSAGQTNSGTGICLYDSVNNKTISWVLYKTAAATFFFGAARWTGTGFVGSVGSNSAGTSGYKQFWLRIRVVSGVAYFDYSSDGLQWINHTNYTISGHMSAPNGAGLFTFSDGTAQYFRTEWYQDPTVNPVEAGIGGTSASNWSYLLPPVDIPILSDFVQQNLGAWTVANSAKGRGIVCKSSSTTQSEYLFLREGAAYPAGSFSRYMTFSGQYHGTTSTGTSMWLSASIILRNSSNGRMVAFAIQPERGASDGYVGFERYSDYVTSGGGTRYALPMAWFPKWMRLDVTTTDVKLFTSVDGETWIEMVTESFATYLTAAGGSVDQIGLGSRHDGSSTAPVSMSFYNYGPNDPAA